MFPCKRAPASSLGPVDLKRRPASARAGGPLLRSILVVSLLLAPLAAPALAWHGHVVLLDVVVPAGVHRLEYSPSEHLGGGHVDISCPTGALQGWQQSNVTEDLLMWPCVGGTSYELPPMGHGAGYTVNLVADAPTHVRVTGAPGWWHWPHDPRPFAFLWGLDGPDFHAHATTGHFRPATDMTDVRFRTETGIQAELFEMEPEIRHLGSATLAGAPVADLVEGRLYLVEMTILASCQPECWARSEVSVQGSPAP